MFKEDKELLLQEPETPRKRWTCSKFHLGGCLVYSISQDKLVEWTYYPDNWCHPVEYKGS
jgi:hypothetical protein